MYDKRNTLRLDLKNYPAFGGGSKERSAERVMRKRRRELVLTLYTNNCQKDYETISLRRHTQVTRLLTPPNPLARVEVTDYITMRIKISWNYHAKGGGSQVRINIKQNTLVSRRSERIRQKNEPERI